MCERAKKAQDSQRMSEEYEPGLVSVIIPTYNRADLVRRAIQSALNQTYQNFEIIVVDDGSIDNTEEVVRNFKDARIHYIRHKENRGGSAARNTGIKATKGEYIAFLDSDCEWLPEKIEKQLKIFDKGGNKLGAVGAGTIGVECNKEHPVRVSFRRGEFGDIYKKLLTDKNIVKNGWPGGTPTIMIRRECFNKIGFFDELLDSCQEHDLYIRIAKYYHFDAVREPLVRVNHDASHGISSSMNARLKGRMRLLEKYSEEIPQRSSLRSHLNSTVGSILCYQGKMKEGRRYLFKAIASQPYSLTKWINFLMSLFPFKIYRYLNMIKGSFSRHIIQLAGNREHRISGKAD